MTLLGKIQRLLLIGGVALIGIYVGMQIHRAIMSRTGLLVFEKVRAEAHVAKAEGVLGEPSQKVDFKLWSEKRIAAYEQSLLERFDPPLAVLRIAKVNLEVPVLEGTDDLTLNRGVGHIAGTGRPGEEGNIGIAGHRDGFFRVLKDIGPGDAIEVVTASRRDVYRVDQIILVDPSDVSVLQARPGRWLTLVTCYPFYFVGSAPQRYIVQASLADSESSPSAGGRANEVATSKN
jgi:sortase A